MVLARGADGIGDRALGMADLQPEIPQQIEELFDDDAGGAGPLAGRQHQKVDIRQRGQLAAPVTTDGNKRKTLAAMPRLDRRQRRGQKLVHAERVAPDIDSAVAPAIELGGEIVLQLLVKHLCRCQKRSPEGRIASFEARATSASSLSSASGGSPAVRAASSG